LESIVPTVALPFGTVSTCQLTVVLFEPVTVAVKDCVCHFVIAARFGLTVTAVFPGLTVMVIFAGADLAASVTEAAVNVTDGFAGALEGPVYRMGAPEALEVAESVPQPGEQFPPDCVSVQVTPLFCESFCTMAVKSSIALNCTLIGVGDTLTATLGVTVIAAGALFVVSATEMAVSVTFVGLG
jgi:hypothetical protein